MPEYRIITKALKANLDGNRFQIIPVGQTIQVGPTCGYGLIRIFWSGSQEGFGGLTVTESDFNTSTKG